MKIIKITSLTIIAMAFISACTSNYSGTNSLNSDTSDTGSDSTDTSDLLSGADPTQDLFDTASADTEPAPDETVTNVTAADATAQSCMSSNNAWAQGTSNASQAQWSCLANNASQGGSVGQDTVLNLAATSLNMYNSCGVAVRQELLAQISALKGMAITTAKTQELFQLAQVKLTQCYYRVVNLQSNSTQWSPYQSQVYNYNAGNIYNLMSGWQ